ncbi:MAG: glycoside hydrolase family 127 protein [Armatimonadetes bacterium]|nr:glycoside hydrolase family 127 protein [Armatimonadota bacterium]
MSSRKNPVIDLSHSRYAKLQPAALSEVSLHDDFWQPRRIINRDKTIPAQYTQCATTGRIDNFRRASGKIQGDFQGIFFNDSDVYKWVEAASFSLATDPNLELDSLLDSVIQEIADAQQPNGYLNTYFMFEREKDRYSNLKDMHELYCAGHLVQAAVAHHRATGKTDLLDVACKLCDHFYEVFGTGKRLGTCGHEELEMALVELYRDTQDENYLTLAELMMDARGKKPGIFQNSAYHQDHLPFTEQTDLVGHAVRHLYYCCGGADVALEKDSAGYRNALEALWKSLTERRSYITGGAGSRYEGESFGKDYELPNDRAYTETCAAIASVMWNFRMLHLTGEARFADVMENTLYNAVLPGISLDGVQYFYENPLADRGEHRRQEWFGCACCPPNVARLLASLPGYFYSTAHDSVYIHLYATSSADISLGNGTEFSLSQSTNYPWDGVITLTIEQDTEVTTTLRPRIPSWAGSAKIAVNGGDAVLFSAGYASLNRVWKAGDTVTISLPMEVHILEGHPQILGNRGRAAVRRGALIYCVEAADNSGVDTWDIALTSDTRLVPITEPNLLNGVVVLKGEGVVLNSSGWEGQLYRSYSPAAQATPYTFTAVPYYAWANREAGAVQVWLPMVTL